MSPLRAWAYFLWQTGFIWLPVVIAFGVAAGLAWLFARLRRPPRAPRPPTSGAAA
jgi:hypothetical protein